MASPEEARTGYIRCMSEIDTTDLLEQALKLPPQARLALADELLDSVEGPEDPEWTAAWAAELERRVKQLENGEAKAVPWEEARARILAKLRSR